MKALAALLLAAAGLVAACNSEPNPTGIKSIDDGDPSGFSISGAIYGFTGGPDSSRVALGGVVVSVVRLADLDPDTTIVDPDTGIGNPDTTGVPPDTVVVPDTIACPITKLCARPAGSGLAFLLDTIPTPPTSCFDDGEVITATTDASGSFTLTGLTDGVYGVKVEPAGGSGYNGFSYCGGIQLDQNRPDPLNFYLTASP